MSIISEDIDKLNQIIAIIDEKASLYKSGRYHMPRAKADADKKLIIDLIDSGLMLARHVGKQAMNIIEDLERLKKQFNNF